MNHKHFIFLMVAFTILNFVDAAITIYALAQGATELNPIMAKNINIIYEIKIIGTISIITIAYIICKRYNSTIPAAYPACFMAVIVAWNMAQILIYWGI